MQTTLSREQVTAFRLAAHHLSAHLQAGALAEACGACGIQNTPPGATELALHARVSALAPGDLDRCLLADKSLLQVWSLRAAPHIFPTADAMVFTRGLLPQTEPDLRHFMLGARSGLDSAGISAVELAEWTAAALDEMLAGQAMTKDEMGRALAGRLEARLQPAQLAAWRSLSPVARGQTWGESLARFALPVAALRGVCCHAERRGGKAYLRRVDEWLASAVDGLEAASNPPVADIGDGGLADPGSPIPATEAVPATEPVPAAGAALELLRRYLHCYAPSTPPDFAAWAGISPQQARAAWEALRPELAETSFNRRRAFLLAADTARMQSPPAPSGVRLLPAHDPYLQSRDHATLAPERSRHARIWRAVGSPGVVLADGELTGVWRSRQQSSLLEVEIELFGPLAPALRLEAEAEAAALLPIKGCRYLKLTWHG